jgi:alpha-N-arabinofuranosidase
MFALTPANATDGKVALQLIPSSTNAASDLYTKLYGVVQAVPAASFAGHQMYVSGWMQADPGSTAVLRILVFLADGTSFYQEIRQKPSPAGPVLRRDTLLLSTAPAPQLILVGCLVEGTSGAAYFDDVQLTDTVPSSWLEAKGMPDEGSALSATIAVNAARHIRNIPRSLYGANLEWPQDGNGVWNESGNALDLSIVSLAQAAGVTSFRFPGGIFSDFYHWADGVGPQSARPQDYSIPGGVLSAQHFGTDEAIAFAQTTGGELLVTVNIATGTAREAADWVRYINGNSQRVRYWEIGNEPYGTGTSSATAAAAMTPEAYAATFLEFAAAMKAVDPGIQVGAAVDENYAHALPRPYPDWTERVLKTAGTAIDFLAIHAPYAPVITVDRGWDSRTVYAAMLAAPALVRDQLTELSARVDAADPSSSHLRLAVTEWGPAFQASMNGRFYDHTKTLGSALFAASTLKTFIESERVDVANAFKLVDLSPLGWIGTFYGSYTSKPTLLALQMFTRHFGPILIDSSTAAPSYDSPSVGWVDAASQISYLEAVSSISSDHATLYLIAINKHLDRSIRAKILLNGFAPTSFGTAYTLDATDADSNTGTQLFIPPGDTLAPQAELSPHSSFQNGNPGALAIRPAPIAGVSNTFEYTFPPHSVTSLVLTARRPRIGKRRLIN